MALEYAALGASVAGNILGTGIENVFAVYYTTGTALSLYGVLSTFTNFYPLVFVPALVAAAVYLRDWRVLRPSAGDPTWESFVLLVFIGLFNILNGFLVIYGSPATRCPPVIQALSFATPPLFSIPFSKWLNKDRRPYCSTRPLICGAAILLGVALGATPLFVASAQEEGHHGAQKKNALGNESTADKIYWTIVFVFGQGFGALYNVLQQRYLERQTLLSKQASFFSSPSSSSSAAFLSINETAGEEEEVGGGGGEVRGGGEVGVPSDARIYTVAILRVLAWSTLLAAIWFWVLFPVDLLPWFGSTHSVSEWAQETGFALRCAYGAARGEKGCLATTPLYALGFNASYVVAFIASAHLNFTSATFTLLCSIATTAAVAVFWLIPGTNPAGNDDSALSIGTSVAAIVLVVPAMAGWKHWEIQVDRKIKQEDAKKGLLLDEQEEEE